MKELVSSEVAAALASLSGQKRVLQRAGPTSNVGSVNADPSEAAAAKAAANLMAK